MAFRKDRAVVTSPRSLPDASFLLEQWEARYQRHLSSLEDESEELRSLCARLAPTGEAPEENLSGELIAAGERYLEMQERISTLKSDDNMLRMDVDSALAGAKELDLKLQEYEKQASDDLAAKRRELKSSPHLVGSLRSEISRLKTQLQLTERSRELLHQCRWCEVRKPLAQLQETGWETRPVTDLAIGTDPMMGRAGIVGDLEALQQRLDRMTR